jgi:hypothetical protein
MLGIQELQRFAGSGYGFEPCPKLTESSKERNCIAARRMMVSSAETGR